MRDPPNSDERQSLIADVILWLRQCVDKYAQLAELDKCSKEDLERIARDAGVSAPELRILTGKRRDAADLLYRRMRVLHLDPDETGRAEPAVLRDLQRLCSLCESRGRCQRDLSEHAVNATWQDYCPNAMTLRSLLAAQPEPDDLEALIVRLNAIGVMPSEMQTGPERGRDRWMH